MTSRMLSASVKAGLHDLQRRQEFLHRLVGPHPYAVVVSLVQGGCGVSVAPELDLVRKIDGAPLRPACDLSLWVTRDLLWSQDVNREPSSTPLGIVSVWEEVWEEEFEQKASQLSARLDGLVFEAAQLAAATMPDGEERLAILERAINANGGHVRRRAPLDAVGLAWERVKRFTEAMRKERLFPDGTRSRMAGLGAGWTDESIPEKAPPWYGFWEEWFERWKQEHPQGTLLIEASDRWVWHAESATDPEDIDGGELVEARREAPYEAADDGGNTLITLMGDCVEEAILTSLKRHPRYPDMEAFIKETVSREQLEALAWRPEAQ